MVLNLFAQDWPVVTSKGGLVFKVISGSGIGEGLTLRQLLLGQDAEHYVLGLSCQLVPLFVMLLLLLLFLLAHGYAQHEQDPHQAEPQKSPLHFEHLFNSNSE